MRYLCLVYFGPNAFDGITEDENRKLTDESIAYDEELARNGNYIASDALQGVETATMVRNRNGKISMTDGPFAETKEHLGGFILIEARDLNEALQIAGKIPVARLGSIEVRPVQELEKSPA